MTKKVFVEVGYATIRSFFEQEGFELTNSLYECDFAVLGGGSDVDPLLYNEVNTHSFVDHEHDREQMELIRDALSLGKKVVGICKGGQMLNVVFGGKMIQQLEGHGPGPDGTHHLIYDERLYDVTSTHHQGMVPPKVGVDVTKSLDGVVEIVADTQKQWLAFQPHPEFVPKGHSCRKLFLNLLREYEFI